MNIAEQLHQHKMDFLLAIQDIIFNYIYLTTPCDQLELLKVFREKNLELFNRFLSLTADDALLICDKEDICADMIKKRVSEFLEVSTQEEG